MECLESGWYPHLWSQQSLSFIFLGTDQIWLGFRAKREVSTYVCAFIFSYEQSSVLERCFSSPAATLGMPDFYFSFFPFHRIQHATIVSETFPASWIIHTDTHQSVRKKSSYGLAWQLFSSTLDERNGCCISKRLSVLVPRPWRARQRRWPGCLSCRCRVPGSRREGDSQVFPKSLGTQALGAPGISGSSWSLYYLQFWVSG